MLLGDNSLIMYQQKTGASVLPNPSWLYERCSVFTRSLASFDKAKIQVQKGSKKLIHAPCIWNNVYLTLPPFSTHHARRMEGGIFQSSSC